MKLETGFDTDLDGMSDAWERKLSLNPNAPTDGNQDHNNDGFTSSSVTFSAVSNDKTVKFVSRNRS